MSIKQDPITGELSARHPVKSDWLTKRNNGDVPLPEVQKPDSLAAGHAAHWQNEAGSDDPALNNLGSVHAELARSFDALVESREARNPNTPQAAHLDSISRHFDSTMTRLASAADRAKEAATKRLYKIEDDFRSVVKWDEKHAQELRGVLRGLSASEKSEFIGAAIQNKDGATLAAVLGAPAALSGITPDQQKAYRGRALHTHAPDLAKLEKTLHTAIKTTSEAFTDMLATGPALTAAAVRAEYAAQAEKAEAARAGLNTSIV